MRMLLLADMHIGSIKDIPYYYDTVTDIIEKEVELKKTDAVIILGDYFDRLFKANEEYVSLAINIMSYLIRACIKNKTKIRLIYGTESHEMNQYRLFNYHFSSKLVDIKLFTTCTEEELFPNVHVLYVPEEYVSDKHEFYKNTIYSGKKYDYIFGHGNIVEGLPTAMAVSLPASNKVEKQVPRFNSGELANASKLCVFGHYHKHVDIGNNVYYLGSLFRSSFGEEEPKGYGIVEDYKLTFVENKEAYVYNTYEFDEKSDVYNDSDSLLKAIDKIKEKNPDIFSGKKVGNIRMIFHPPVNVDKSFYENLKNLLSNDKVIRPLIKETMKSETTDEDGTVDDEYEFILDNSMNIIDKIHTFINKQYDTDIPLKELTKYIKDELEI